MRLLIRTTVWCTMPDILNQNHYWRNKCFFTWSHSYGNVAWGIPFSKWASFPQWLTELQAFYPQNLLFSSILFHHLLNKSRKIIKITFSSLWLQFDLYLVCFDCCVGLSPILDGIFLALVAMETYDIGTKLVTDQDNRRNSLILFPDWKYALKY